MHPTSSLKVILILVISVSGIRLSAQGSGETKDIGAHRLTLVMSHTSIPSGLTPEGKKKWLALASWGLDYDYWFSNSWALGLHTDMVVENFQVEVSEDIDKDKILARKQPISLVPIVAYKPLKHVNLLAGFGSEFSKDEESLLLARVGMDVGWEISEKYEVAFSIVGDFKIEAYDSITLGIGISRIFK